MAPGLLLLLSILPSLIFSRQIVTTDLVPVLVMLLALVLLFLVRVPKPTSPLVPCSGLHLRYQFDHSYQPQLQ